MEGSEDAYVGYMTIKVKDISLFLLHCLYFYGLVKVVLYETFLRGK